jgi:hypothetical protein
MADDLNSCFEDGLDATTIKEVGDVIEALSAFVSSVQEQQKWAGKTKFVEKELQSEARTFLSGAGMHCQEGAEVGGGETDLLLGKKYVLENKKTSVVSDPLVAGERYEWQARKYSVAVMTRIAFVLLAFEVEVGKPVPPVVGHVKVEDVSLDGDQRAVIRFIVPWGGGTPSAAKVPT